eukprot:365540-Chlamydomonas_euryale.AAC.5
MCGLQPWPVGPTTWSGVPHAGPPAVAHTPNYTEVTTFKLNTETTNGPPPTREVGYNRRKRNGAQRSEAW